MPHGVQPPSSNCAEPLEPFLSVQTPEKRSFFFFFSVLVSGKTQPGEAHSAKVRPKPPGVIQPETPKQSGGRSPFRMNPTQNSATCYSDNYDKELRSTESCSKVPVNVQRLQLCLVDIAWLGNLAGQGAVFFFCWEGEIFITRSNDNNLKET